MTIFKAGNYKPPLNPYHPHTQLITSHIF